MLPVNGRRRREDERKTIGRKKTLGDLPCTDATLGVAKNVPAPSALPRGPGGGARLPASRRQRGVARH